MKLFGKTILEKNNHCSFNGQAPKEANPYINLYVRLTNNCPGNCSFCLIPKEKRSGEYTFDFYKFYYVLSELNKSTRINKVSFTGGEPTLLIDTLNKCLETTKSINKDIFTVVNSNGLKIRKTNYNFLDSFCLSRHAILDEDIKRIFGGLPVSNNDLWTLDESIKNKTHISCNLIKGEIDNIDKIYSFINAYSNLGFHDFGLVSLMKTNQFCEDHFIDFKDIELEKMQNTIKTKTFNLGKSCRCNNFLTYTDAGVINKLYARYYTDCSSMSAKPLVFDIDKLTNGFDGELII